MDFSPPPPGLYKCNFIYKKELDKITEEKNCFALNGRGGIKIINVYINGL